MIDGPDMSTLCSMLGVTEADIKSCTRRWGYDIIDVTLWNRRRFAVTGLEWFNQRTLYA